MSEDGKQLRLKATLWSEDGGKTWGVREVFYLRETYYHVSDEFLDSAEAKLWVFERIDK